MTNTTTECVQRFAAEGPLGAATLVCLWIVLGGVFAWLLWRERRVTGVARAWIFWLLRVTALGAVLWMLLGLAKVDEYRTTTVQSVALVADASESMDVADPPGTPGMVRWDIAHESGREPPLLASCDRAAVALRIAATQCQLMRDSLQRHSPAGQPACYPDMIERAVRRSVECLEESLRVDDHGDKEYRARIGRILTQIQGDPCRGARELRTSTKDDGGRSTDDTLDLLQGIDNSLTGVNRRLQSLCQDLAAASESSVGARDTDKRVLTRRRRVAALLASVDNAAPPEPGEPLAIKRFRFDRLLTPVASGSGWSDVLSDQTARYPTGPPNGAADGSFADPVTDISTALENLAGVADRESICAAIVFSDGRHNAPGGRPPEEVAASLGNLVVHVVPIGDTRTVRDVYLHRVDAPAAVAKDDSIVIDVIVTATRCDGETTSISVQRDGEPIEERPLVFNGDRVDQRLSFHVPAEENGRREFTLSIEPLPEEHGTANNSASVAVEVMQDKLRVLLADRISRWEFRYLEQLFRRDEHVEFDKLLFNPTVSATGPLSESRALPRDADSWSRYDVVILGDLETRHLDPGVQEALSQHIRRAGGNLVVIAGRENMPHQFAGQPLIDLLPVGRDSSMQRGTGFTLSPTQAGKMHPALLLAPTPDESAGIWERQYKWRPINSLSEYCRPKPTAQTWLKADPREAYAALTDTDDERPRHAFLCWHQVGAGKVVYLASPMTYQLRFRQGDRYHHRFWGQLLRWITSRNLSVGTENVRIATDRVRYKAGEEVDVTVRLRDSRGNPVREAELTAVARGGPETPQADSNERQAAANIALIADEKVPGRYRGKILGLSRGAYHIEPAGDVVDRLLKDDPQHARPSTLVTVETSSGIELGDARCNFPLLERVAEITGGQVVPPTAVDEVLRLSAIAPEVSRRVESRPLWNRWSLLILVFACVCAEWVARKRMGLV